MNVTFVTCNGPEITMSTNAHVDHPADYTGIIGADHTQHVRSWRSARMDRSSMAMLLGAVPERSACQYTGFGASTPTFDASSLLAYDAESGRVFLAEHEKAVAYGDWAHATIRSSHCARTAHGQWELSFCALPHMMPAIQPGRGVRAAASHDDLVMTRALLRTFKKCGVHSRAIRICLSFCPGLNNLDISVPTTHDPATD